jgi:hypothetical protein
VPARYRPAGPRHQAELFIDLECLVNGENNRILDNTSLQNTGFDLFDRKPDCDNNTWSGNVFGTAEPLCTTGP